MTTIRPFDPGSIRLPGAPGVRSAPDAPGARSAPLSPSPGADAAGPVADRDRLFAVSSRISELERSNIRALRADDALGDLDALLSELKQAVAEAAASNAGPSEGGAQQRINELTESIATLAERTERPDLLRALRSGGVQVAKVSDQVVVLGASARLAPGQDLEINVEVTASAQTAGFLLSFAGPTLNLGGSGVSDGAASRFAIEIAGNLGAQELTFASGTSLNELASGINAFSDQTGVRAVVSGTGIRLDSTEYGADAFVSVRVNDDGAINTAAAGAGVYALTTNDAGAADPSSAALFSASANPRTDWGQDVQALVNGLAATGAGTRITLKTDELFVDLNLKTGPAGPGGVNASNLGLFRALVLVSERSGFAPGGLPPSPTDLDRFAEALGRERAGIAEERRALGEQLARLHEEMSAVVSQRHERSALRPPSVGEQVDAQSGALTPDRVAALLRARLVDRG